MHLRPFLPLIAALGAGLSAQTPPPAPAAAPPPPPSIAGFALTGTVTFGSQYIWRGLTQTDGKPTIQGELDLVHPSGWYFSTAMSNITWFTDQNAGLGSDPTALGSPGRVGPPLYDPRKANTAGVEWDLFGGYKWGFAKDWTLDLGVFYYVYPGSYENLGAFRNPTSAEAYLGLAYSWASLKYSRAITRNFMGIYRGQGESYIDLSLAVPLGDNGWSLQLHAGKTTYPAEANLDFFTNGPVVAGDNSLFSYADYRIGLAKEIKGYTLVLAGTNADSKARARDNEVPVYENALGRNIGKSRVTFTVTKAF